MADSQYRIKKMNSESATSMDIISDLPDSLQQHILSFLDMKQVVQTCCLSKKWIDIWKSAPDLNFDYNYDVDENKVMNLLLYVLHHVLHRRVDSRIKKLQLSRLRFSAQHKLTNWLTVVLQRHVEEVYLDSLVYPGFEIYWELPHFLFTSSTVKVLSYKHISPATVALKLPNSILTATQLTTLSLQYVRLVPGDSDGELILSCPVLEILSLMYCHNDYELRMLNISAFRLKSLKIYGYRGNDYTKLHKIKICTPNLTSLDLYHPYYNDFYLEDLPSLVRANIQLDIDTLSMKCINKILNQLHNVTALKLNILSLGSKTSPGSGGMLNQLQNPFSNLRNLSLDEIRAGGIELVQSLLNFSPHIQTLVLNMNKDDRDLCEELSLHKFKFNHLKFVRIFYFNGHEKEYKLLSSILKNAVVLENLTLFNMKILSRERNEIIERLSSLPKASSNVKVSFS